MKAEMEDGTVFSGDTPEDVVRHMRDGNWSAPERKSEYIEEVAVRVEGMTGSKIRATNATEFLCDLERAELLKLSELDETQALAFTKAAASGADMQPTGISDYEQSRIDLNSDPNGGMRI